MRQGLILPTVKPVIISLILFLGLIPPLEAGIKEGISDYFFEKKAVDAVEGYTENLVLETLSQLVQNLDALNQAVNVLDSDRTDDNLIKATEFWRAALAQYNKAWVFNYGPAAHYDFHKQLATWPFDKILVDHALGEVEAGRLTVSAQNLRSNKHSSTRGLYTVQYFLFQGQKIRKAKDITAAEMSYLLAACQALLEEGIDFEASWRGTENLSAKKRAILKEAGIRPRPAYADEFTKPGTPDSRYLSISVPLQEIFQECTSVLEDMMIAIEDLVAFNPDRIEYWDSVDPYVDVLNLLRGVENAYYGGVEDARGPSISELVAEKNVILDRRIKAAFAHTEARINAIRDLRTDASREEKELTVRIAVSECEKLIARLTAATPIVTADPALKPWAAYGK